MGNPPLDLTPAIRFDLRPSFEELILDPPGAETWRELALAAIALAAEQRQQIARLEALRRPIRRQTPPPMDPAYLRDLLAYLRRRRVGDL